MNKKEKTDILKDENNKSNDTQKRRHANRTKQSQRPPKQKTAASGYGNVYSQSGTKQPRAKQNNTDAKKKLQHSSHNLGTQKKAKPTDTQRYGTSAKKSGTPTTGLSSNTLNKKPKTNIANHAQKRKKHVADKNAPELHIYPLGGLSEVGKNITVFECNGDMIIVDCGLVFPDSDMYGVDLVIPDFTFIVQNKNKIKGLIVTHGHEDHIGSIPYLLKQINIPIYATKLTLGLLQNKLEEHGLSNYAKCTEIHPQKKFKLGCYTIEPIHVNHSIPDAVGFAIDSPAGVVLHTGDFKIDYTPLTGGPTDLATIGKYGQSGVLALMSDSTNAERGGFTMTEKKVSEAFATLFNQAVNQRIIIATFASNLYRVQQIIDMAVEKGRKIAVSGRSMVNNTEMAMKLGYLHAPDGTLINIDEIGKYPAEKIVIITTGSQGEPLSALSRMSISSHRNVKVGSGDFIIISATPIPGNEKMVTKVVNGLLKLGAHVIYESMYEVHVSGHACQEEQKLILNLAKPQFFIPAHGEYKHLIKHAQTAIDVGVPKNNVYIGENGDHIILSKNGIRTAESVTAGVVLVDGLGVGDVGSIVLRDRRHLSEDGIVIVICAIDTSTGQIASGPDIVTRGFVYVKESELLIEETCAQVRLLFDKLDSAEIRDFNSLKSRVRETVSAYLYRRTKRSPMILPITINV